MTSANVAAERRASRRALREKIAKLRAELRAALAAKTARMRELVRAIRAERLALRERLRAERKQALAALVAAARAERLAAREEWRRRIVIARAEATSDAERVRAEIAATRVQAAAERDVERALWKDRAAHAAAVREQSDEEVRALIPRELVPVFNEVAKSFRGSTAESRAERFLRYAEENAEGIHKFLEPAADAHVERTKVALEEATKAASARLYQAKRAARVERMRANAARLKSAAGAAHARAEGIANMIPMGQPILVGHHSERRHRRDLERMQRSFSSAVDLSRKAEVLAKRADYAEANRAVSSDDPEAIEKLREKVAALNAQREKMRDANAAIRAGGDVVAKLVALGFREDRAKKLLEPDFAGRVGFPDYALRNAAAEVARVERRIRKLEARAVAPAPPDVAIGDARISEAENRVRITFPGPPPESVRRALKSRGFRWAPSVGAWQRHASHGAWSAAKDALAGYGGAAP